jgi:hypothetical protein
VAGGLLLAVVVVGMGAVIVARGSAQPDPEADGCDFRVENRVFVGEDEAPVGHSTTLFHQAMVYDYLENPAEVVVFDRKADLFTLLDPARQVRCEIADDEVLVLAERVRELAGRQSDPLLRFFATPRFDERFDPAAGELILSSPWLTYRLSVEEPAEEDMARQVREFSDGYARLNALLSPGSRPPSARLVVNEALEKRAVIAREVRLAIDPPEQSDLPGSRMRSQHDFAVGLAESDLARVRQTRQWMQDFRWVTFDAYRRVEAR